MRTVLGAFPASLLMKTRVFCLRAVAESADKVSALCPISVWLQGSGPPSERCQLHQRQRSCTSRRDTATRAAYNGFLRARAVDAGVAWRFRGPGHRIPRTNECDSRAVWPARPDEQVMFHKTCIAIRNYDALHLQNHRLQWNEMPSIDLDTIMWYIDFERSKGLL